ncbi:hypothetical protein ABT065_37175 [Streptomyces sp. NPDC002764]|uniref:hypothetical protein n=1 Tax=Streptomyces sp. NPDC002764 TaxID=3154428 RepID=UPI00332A80B1
MEWLSKADWGTVPAWLGAGSLILAFRVFLRDRRNAERNQVDSVGAWGSIESIKSKNGQFGVQTAIMRLSIKNSSDLPVDIVDATFGVAARLINSTGKEVALRESGYRAEISAQQHPEEEKFRVGVRRLPPGETWVSPHGFDITFNYPDVDDSGKLRWDIQFVVLSLIVLDNAGRVWQLRPASGSRAREVRWYNKKRVLPKMWWKADNSGGGRVAVTGGYEGNSFAAVWGLQPFDSYSDLHPERRWEKLWDWVKGVRDKQRTRRVERRWRKRSRTRI